MFRFKPIVAAASLAAVFALAACGQAKDAPPDQTAPSESKPNVPSAPVELTLYYMYSDWTEELMQRNIGQYVQQKYPHISFKLIQNTKGTTPSDIIAAKTDVDLILATQGQIYQLADLGLLGDATDLVSANKLDLTKLEQGSLETMKRMTDGKITGLPYKINALALYYNKDLFDRFGVPYPSAQMTWDQLYDVARKMTRTEGGVQYRGFSFASTGNYNSLNQYGQELVDPNTLKPTFLDPFWTTHFAALKRFYDIEGNGVPSELINKQTDLFNKEKTVAMSVGTVSGFPRNDPSFNWDIAPYPLLDAKSDVGPPAAPTFLMLSATSKHRSEAFQTIAHMVSKEVQTALSQAGNIVVLQDDAVKKQFGTSVEELKGKQASALVPKRMAPPITWNKYTIKAQSVLGSALNRVITGQADINTALREAQEAAEKEIAALK